MIRLLGLVAAHGPAPPPPGLADTERRDLLEIIEDRHANRSTVLTSHLPVAKWHDHLGDPTVADAICDRLLHNAHPLALQGPSRRKEAAPKDWNPPASLRSVHDPPIRAFTMSEMRTQCLHRILQQISGCKGGPSPYRKDRYSLATREGDRMRHQYSPLLCR